MYFFILEKDYFMFLEVRIGEGSILKGYKVKYFIISMYYGYKLIFNFKR